MDDGPLGEDHHHGDNNNNDEGQHHHNHQHNHHNHDNGCHNVDDAAVEQGDLTSETVSISLESLIRDVHQPSELEGKRNKSALEFTMGYGQDEIEIDSSQPWNNRDLSNSATSHVNLQLSNFSDDDQDSSDDEYDSLEVSMDRGDRDLRRPTSAANTNSTRATELGQRLKSYDCAMPYLRLLRDNRAYRYYFFSSLISMMGDWFNELACLTLLHRFGASGLMVSLYLILRECPPFLFQPLTGVVSDRFDRRHIMIATDLLRTLIVPLFLFVRSPDSLWLLYLLAFLQFTIGAFFMPAKSALLPSLVKKDDLITANATEQTSYSSMMLFGASLGGSVSYILGTNANYLIDSMTYIGSAICVFILIKIGNSPLGYQGSNVQGHAPLHSLEDNEYLEEVDLDAEAEAEADNGPKAIILTETNRSIQTTKQQQNGQRTTHKVWSSIKEYMGLYRQGLKFLGDNHYILLIALTKSCGAMVWSGIDTVLIRFAQVNFKMGDDGSLSLGIILACGGLGVLLVPFVFARIVKDTPENHINILRYGYFMNCFGTFWLAFTSTNFPLFLISNVVRSSSTCVLWLYSSSILQQRVPDHVRGRVFSFEFGILQVVAVFARLATGFMLDVAQYSPTKITYIYGGIGAVIFILWNLIITKYKHVAATMSTH
ncbi:hypothetical protein SAMD00019534_058020 [Acytostelium subglobosum LB1]|uniref:hypothetical protein n=1 Tax=Acytostelium subglobosum LB1 TaxID=1410327 RepID=UPI00064491A1|nr:hypothetical protein SAMD00019534_058020 [Acytostelium subglobosum LB1]GAM22627.1 hypothetical protein SAMD00019534_058020 [Acytostelium subglobosum LB1]|eukprot:XP_012754747.1 hypothetical protein SAMD00019534_058020 [Acytostelium subglobosum LB1]